MNKKATCFCYKNLVKVSEDRYQCTECGKIFTKVKYLIRKKI